MSLFTNLHLVVSLTLIPIITRGQVLVLPQNPNLALLKQLNISNDLYSTYLHDDISTEIKARWMAKAVIPAHLQELLNLFKEYETFGLLNEFTGRLFEGVDNEDCKGHILEWIIRLDTLLWITEKDKWAAHMIDSWGKIPEGILTGHVNSYGDFDECVQAKASEIAVLNINFTDIPTSFEGSYCTSYILDYGTAMLAAGRLPDPADETNKQQFSSILESEIAEDSIGVKNALSVAELLVKLTSQNGGLAPMLPSTATCMPSSCSLVEVQNILLNGVTMMYEKQLGDKVNITELLYPVTVNCSTGKKPDMDAAVIIVIIFLTTLLVLCVGAGVVDYWLNHDVEKAIDRGTGYKYLMAFSFYSNTKKWLSTRRSSDDLGCLHGIRFFSTAWVILGHTFRIFVLGPQWNLVEYKSIWKNWTMLAVINGTFSVDTFFVMSGMLVTYNILKMLDRTKGKLNLAMFYINRIVRLTPTYAILVAIAATLTIYLGGGPNWYSQETIEKNCRKNWWVNLLYINNIYKSDDVCNGESWYLANDMQFYILSPFIVYPIWKWRKLGIGLLALYTLLSIIAPALVYHYDKTFPAILIATSEETKFFLNINNIYYRPWTRIQTFFVGAWLGWILHITRGKSIKLPGWAVILGWLLSTALAMTVIFAVHPWFDPENEVPRTAGFFYAGLSRFTYGVSVAWVIFACIKGYGGIVNSFLSWKVFMPLGRLCFCVYLISLHMQITFHMGLKVPLRYDTYTLVNVYFAHMVSSYLAGFVATMLFESPFIILQKLIFTEKGRKDC